MRLRLKTTFDAMEKAIKAEKEEYELAREEKKQKAIKAAKSQTNTIEFQMPDGKKISMPNPARSFANLDLITAFSMPSASPLFGDSDFVSKISEQEMKELRRQFADWRDRTKQGLESVFMDFTPVHTFMDARGEWYSQSFPLGERRTEEYINITRQLDAKVAVLIGFYKTLSENIRSPLIYLPDQAKVCFYDFICPLKAGDNEASLCVFLFQHSIGEKVEMVDAYNYMFGDQHLTLDTIEKNKIKNAADGINRKTNKAFGFPIVAKDTNTVNLTVPTRVTQNLL